MKYQVQRDNGVSQFREYSFSKPQLRPQISDDARHDMVGTAPLSTFWKVLAE